MPVDSASDSPDLEALFEQVASARSTLAEVRAGGVPFAAGAEQLGQRLGTLTRSLHETLRELGHERSIQDAAAALPDSRERLAYVERVTGEAAHKVLSLTECALPVQQAIGREAEHLSGMWQKCELGELGAADFRALISATCCYLETVSLQADATQEQLREILTAQEFHGLSAQVLRKVVESAEQVESQLLALLVENVSPGVRAAIAVPDCLMNGPVINASGRNDVVTSQEQADELLASLGF